MTLTVIIFREPYRQVAARELESSAHIVCTTRRSRSASLAKLAIRNSRAGTFGAGNHQRR
jgi:hypothetical protein